MEWPFLRMILVGTLAVVNLTACTAVSSRAGADPSGNMISEASQRGAFPLVSASGFVTELWHDVDDFPGVIRAIGDLQADVERVTTRKPKIATSPTSCRQPVIIGTLGRNSLIDSLAEAGKLDASDLKGKWESFVITTIDDPVPGIKQALVIAGSDRRGTIYGIYELSKQLGVSPWYWWADVPPKKRAEAYIVPGRYASGEPSVKYRGIFINDEDWGLKPWASNNYEKDLGDIGPKTYAQVFELILRLKGNMVAPAMHSCTGAFYSHPESKVVADEYGIVMTTSHCEPLLFNNAAKSEWDKNRNGEWNYAINKKTILKKLDDRVKEAAPYENIYTMGMRGLHDEGMRGNMSDADKVKILEEVMADQEDILTKYLNKPLNRIPQIFVPYKETLGLYNLGLKVPDDITLVWTDDNYGYIKRLSTPDEQKRSGGSGVYYHTSYLGAPHDYLWLNTTPPVLMYEELSKAYATGADRYWLLNVGDIKPCEMGLQTFFDFAWNVDRVDFANINHYQSQFLAGIFGVKYENAFQDILDTYYRLAWSRKPEYMGWEREWDTPQYTDISDTDFSFQNYNDAQQRLADYKRIAEQANAIIDELPEAYRPAFFEMVGYPVNGANQMNRTFLLAQLNHELAEQGDYASANWAADQSQAAYDEINRLTEAYNTLLGGKWNGMMAIPPGFCAKYQNMPEVVRTQGAGNKPADLAPIKSEEQLDGCTVIDLRNMKNKVARDGHTIRLINGIGYDWTALQLGEAVEPVADSKDLQGARVEYEFSGVDGDSVTVQVYTVPTFPLYEGRSTRFGISVDGQPAFIAKNEPREYSRQWKDQVLMNGTVATAKFPVQTGVGKHTLTLTCGDPGILIQRIVIDWGGLKASYVGPSASLVIH